jgi:hypothetical protein
MSFVQPEQWWNFSDCAKSRHGGSLMLSGDLASQQSRAFAKECKGSGPGETAFTEKAASS